MTERETLESLKKFRQDIHRHPEVAGEEARTAARVRDFLAGTGPDQIIEGIGGHGVAAVFDSGRSGPAVMFRCELDGLPISEISGLPYRSVYEERGHLCGHDGHMAVMLGLATRIAGHRPATGKAILLFQPAEETGEGAEWVLQDEKFRMLQPDFAFAFHNLPGYPKGRIIIADDVFSSASIGMEIKLTGKSSHAAEPENGINPAKATGRIIEGLHRIADDNSLFEDFVLITFVQIALGDKAFGTSPGHALIRATLRAFRDEDMDKLKELASAEASKCAASEKLKVEISFTEEFPSTRVDRECYLVMKGILQEGAMDYVELDEPFRWSEDFGHFTKEYKGMLFGIGSGEDQPRLHNPDYDFPDDIIETGIDIFYRIYEEYLYKQDIKH